jgi:hypothetical protein
MIPLVILLYLQSCYPEHGDARASLGDNLGGQGDVAAGRQRTSCDDRQRTSCGNRCAEEEEQYRLACKGGGTLVSGTRKRHGGRWREDPRCPVDRGRRRDWRHAWEEVWLTTEGESARRRRERLQEKERINHVNILVSFMSSLFLVVFEVGKKALRFFTIVLETM